MLRPCLQMSSGLALLLTACSSEPSTDPTVVNSPTATGAVQGKAMLTAKPVPGFADVMVPEVSGIADAAAQRINTSLTTLRDRAAQAAAVCRADAGSQPSAYRFAAQPTYNDRGILSLRITGEAACGGAHGNTIAEAQTFDVASGAEVDVVAASGQSPARLAALAVDGYTGEAACKTFLAGDEATLGSAFVAEQGVGVNYAVSVGAAQSCTAEPGLVPWAGLTPSLKAPLKRLAPAAC